MTVLKRPQARFAARTERGPRSSNDDSYFARTFSQGAWVGLFAVADGLGGHLGGAVASKLAVETLAELANDIEVDPDLPAAAALAGVGARIGARLREVRGRRPELERAGTTLTVLGLREDRAYLHHLGDSRLYRGGDSWSLETEDHSIAWRLVQEGTLSPEEYESSPMKNRLYRYVGREDDRGLDRSFSVTAGDRFVLVTDGCLTASSLPPWPADGAGGYNPEAFLDVLFDSGFELRQHDNATCVAVAVS